MRVAAGRSDALGPSGGDHHEPSGRVTGAAMAAVVVIWGLGPPITKLISAPALVSVSVRFWISIPILWLLAYVTGRRMSVGILRATALAGALFGINLAFVFTALQHASVAVIAVIQALQPGVVLIVAGRWLGEQATRWHVSWTVVGVGGVAVVILGGRARGARRHARVPLRPCRDAHLHGVLPDQPTCPFDDPDRPDPVDGRRHAVRRHRDHPGRAGHVEPRRLPPAGRDGLGVPRVRRRCRRHRRPHPDELGAQVHHRRPARRCTCWR